MNLNCPFCAGVLPPPIGSRKISCLYCGKDIYYRAADFVPRFIMAEGEAHDIRSEAEKLFRAAVVHERVRTDAVLVSRRKRYLPFYLLTGKRGGVMETGKERIVQAPSVNFENSRGTVAERAYRRNKPQVVIEEDSRVVLGDFRYVYEAARVDEAESSQDFIRRSILSNLHRISPVSLPELSGKGEVISPDIPRGNIIEKGVMSAKGGKEGLEILSLEAAIIYYPVEELLFRFRESFFTVTYDLVAGRFLWGRLPCRRDAMAIAALVFAAALGFFFGRFVKLFMLPFHEVRTNFNFLLYFGTLSFLVASLVFGGGLNAAFLLLKTQFEAKLTPEGIHVGRWGEIPRTFLTPYLKWMIRFLSDGIEQAVARKRQ